MKSQVGLEACSPSLFVNMRFGPLSVMSSVIPSLSVSPLLHLMWLLRGFAILHAIP